MKKYTPKFIETLFYNLIFWAIVYGIFYLLKKDQIKWAIIFAAIALVYAILAALTDYLKKNIKIASYFTIGLMSLINLTVTSASLVMALRYLKDKNYYLLALFIIIAIIFYYKFTKLFEKDSDKDL